MKVDITQLEDFVKKGGKPLEIGINKGDEHAVLEENEHTCPVGALMVLRATVVINDKEIPVLSSEWVVNGNQIDPTSVTQNIDTGEGKILSGPHSYGVQGDKIAVAWSRAGRFDIKIVAICDSGSYRISGSMSVIAPEITPETPEIGTPAIQGNIINAQRLALRIEDKGIGFNWFIAATMDQFGGKIGFIQTTLGTTERVAENKTIQIMGTNKHYFLDFNEEAQAIWYKSEDIEVGDVTEVNLNDSPSILLEKNDDKYPKLSFIEYALHDNFRSYIAYEAAADTPGMLKRFVVAQQYVEWYWIGVSKLEAIFTLCDKESSVSEIKGGTGHWTLPQWHQNAADFEDWKQI